MLIPVLKKNESLMDMIDKLREEVNELDQAINLYEAYGTLRELENVIEESFDVQQVLTGIFDKLATDEKVDLRKASHDHLVKMINRGWNVKKILIVEE
ncbi:hypothetical protein [Dethiothermospora halolimnae]|uniref:hypothetical protein n=1 Tax=Dethiothermospora halolimnae TaxID=3114390 RepID=UPI003CCBC0C4